MWFFSECCRGSLQYEVPYVNMKDLRNMDSTSAIAGFADIPWRYFPYQGSLNPKPKTTKYNTSPQTIHASKTPEPSTPSLNPNAHPALLPEAWPKPETRSSWP